MATKTKEQPITKTPLSSVEFEKLIKKYYNRNEDKKELEKELKIMSDKIKEYVLTKGDPRQSADFPPKRYFEVETLLSTGDTLMSICRIDSKKKLIESKVIKFAKKNNIDVNEWKSLDIKMIEEAAKKGVLNQKEFLDLLDFEPSSPVLSVKVKGAKDED